MFDPFSVFFYMSLFSLFGFMPYLYLFLDSSSIIVFFLIFGQDKIIYFISNTNQQLQTWWWFNGLHHPSHSCCSLDQHQKTVADHLQQLCFLLPEVAADYLNHQLALLSSDQSINFQLGLLLHQQIEGLESTKVANCGASLFRHPNKENKTCAIK